MKNVIIVLLMGLSLFILIGAIETPSILETQPEVLIRQFMGLEKTKTGK